MHWFLDAANIATVAWRAVDFKGLRRRDRVRVAASFKYSDKGSDCELLWVELTQIGTDSLWGVVASRPLRGYRHGISQGQAVNFERRHVWDSLPFSEPMAI